MIYSIGEKIQVSEQNIIETIKNSFSNIPVNTCQSKVNQTKTSDEISRGDLADCKDLDSLVRYLGQNKFTYDEKSGISSCTICTSQEEVRRNINEENAGYFKVNIEKFTNPSQQPKTLCHLKSRIAEHLFGAQGRDKSAFHQKQLGRIEAEELAESKRPARSYTAEMNLFRILYNEIMQGNSYNSFESSGGSSVSQNKLPQLVLGYIYILKYLQSNSLVRFYSFEIHNL